MRRLMATRPRQTMRVIRKMSDDIMEDCDITIKMSYELAAYLDRAEGEEITLKSESGEIDGEIVATAQNTKTQMARFGLDVIDDAE